MHRKIDCLIEDLAQLLGQPGWVGPEHPRFKRWLTEARRYVRNRAGAAERKRFEALGFVRARPRLWKREEDTPAELRAFRGDLEKARALLEEIRDAEEPPYRVAGRAALGVALPLGWIRF